MFHRLGDSESQKIAVDFAKGLEQAVRQEKQQSAIEFKKTLKQYKKSPRRRKTRTIYQSNTNRLPVPKRSSHHRTAGGGGGGEGGGGVWSSTQLVSHPLGEVVANPGAQGFQELSQGFLSLATQPQQCSQQTTRDLLASETIKMAAHSARQQHSIPLYQLNSIITDESRPLPEVPSVRSFYSL